MYDERLYQKLENSGQWELYARVFQEKETGVQNVLYLVEAAG